MNLLSEIRKMASLAPSKIFRYWISLFCLAISEFFHSVRSLVMAISTPSCPQTPWVIFVSAVISVPSFFLNGASRYLIFSDSASLPVLKPTSVTKRSIIFILRSSSAEYPSLVSRTRFVLMMIPEAFVIKRKSSIESKRS